MIKLENVYLSFLKNCYILYNINLNIEKGEKVLLYGDKDGGKTSLLRIILGLDVPDRGTASINGIPSHNHNFKTGIQTVYIDAHGLFLENKTVLENLKWLLKERKEWGVSSDITLYALLKNYELFHLKDKKLKELTKYQRIMLSLARSSFRKNIELLIVDDIFSELNKDEIKDILKIIEPYLKNKDLTVIISSDTHALFKKYKVKEYKLTLGVLENDK